MTEVLESNGLSQRRPSMPTVNGQSEKMIKVKEDARLYLAEQDIETVNEEAIREADLSRISGKNNVAERSNIDETRLGNIDAVIDMEHPDSSQYNVKDSITLKDSDFERAG